MPHRALAGASVASRSHRDGFDLAADLVPPELLDEAAAVAFGLRALKGQPSEVQPTAAVRPGRQAAVGGLGQRQQLDVGCGAGGVDCRELRVWERRVVWGGVHHTDARLVPATA